MRAMSSGTDTRQSAAEVVAESALSLVHDITNDTYALFDLAADPGELRDLAADRPDELEELKKILRGSVKRSERLAESYETAPELDLSPGVLDRLQGLGYGGGD